MRARSLPQPAMGRPEYRSVACARRLTRATSSRQATSRGQARHTDSRAVSSARLPAPAASVRTWAASVATGVAGVAGRWPARPGRHRAGRRGTIRHCAVPRAHRPAASDQAIPSRMSCSLTSTSANPNRCIT